MISLIIFSTPFRHTKILCVHLHHVESLWHLQWKHVFLWHILDNTQAVAILSHKSRQPSVTSWTHKYHSQPHRSGLVVARPVANDDTLILGLIGSTDLLFLLLFLFLVLDLLLGYLRRGVLGGDGGRQVVALRLEAVLAGRVHHRVGDAVGSRVAELARHAVAVVILRLARLRHRDAVLRLETEDRYIGVAWLRRVVKITET